MAEEQNIVEGANLGDGFSYDELNPKIDALRDLTIESADLPDTNFESNRVSYRVFYSADGQSVKVMPVDNNGQVAAGAEPVSYTHLTLPTKA